MERQHPGVWRPRRDSPTAGELDRAELVVSEIITDPEGNYDKWGRLDEKPATITFRSLARQIDKEFEEYKHYKSRKIPPEDDTQLTGEMFEQD